MFPLLVVLSSLLLCAYLLGYLLLVSCPLLDWLLLDLLYMFKTSDARDLTPCMPSQVLISFGSALI